MVEAVTRAIAEDVLALGDLTAALVPASVTATVAIVSREPGVVAGRACSVETFAQIDPDLAVAWQMDDGAEVVPGNVVAEVSGPLRSILTAERTALNFLCHLSGVASLTRRFVTAVGQANPSTRVLDTRKTTPGLRALEKAAVRAGGGHNHRGSLSDAVLVKDNHLGGVYDRRRGGQGPPVVAGPDGRGRMRPHRAGGRSGRCRGHRRHARQHDPRTGGRMRGPCAGGAAVGPLVEVSGGVSLETAPRLAAAGADLISVGALTHSAPVLDLGFDLPPRYRRRRLKG